MKKLISCLLAFVMLWSAFSVDLFSITTNAVSSKDYCIKATPAITKAAYKYLNDVYIKKYPSLALEYSFGSEKDKNTLKALANKITAGITTAEGKAKAIVDWVAQNIEYVSYSSGEAEYFAIDTYYAKKGNCVGYAQLIVQLCRLCNIKAVMCSGSRGDMKNYVVLEGREMDHAWSMIYYGNQWHLFDSLFDVYGTTDQSFISRWYFTDFIEGVSPYVKQYASYINYGDAVFYIDGRFVHYVKGMPASEYYKMAAEGGTSVNGSLPYYTKNRYYNKTTQVQDGFKYVTNPSKKQKMINDECYYDGWITYGPSIYYAKPNGILAGSTMKNYNGACYYLPYCSGAVIMPGKSADYSFTRGFPTLIKGKTISVKPSWADSEIEEGKVIVWKSETPKTLKVTSGGKITALSEGYGCIAVCSKDSKDDNSHYMFTYIEFWVSPKERTVKYQSKIDASKLDIKLSKTSYTYDGNVKKPAVTVKNAAGRTLKAGTDYTVTYAQGRKAAGTYKVTVKMKGVYSGTKVLTFKINPINVSKCKVSLSADSFVYNGKARTPAVTVKNAAGKVLKKGTDYTVTYAQGRKNVGTYKVTVKMKGSYTGTKILTFKINPAGTYISKLRSGIKSFTVDWVPKTVQTTGYHVQYSTNKNFKGTETVGDPNNKTKKGTVAGLKSGKTYYVRIRTYKTVKGVQYYSAWSSVKTVKVK